MEENQLPRLYRKDKRKFTLNDKFKYYSKHFDEHVKLQVVEYKDCKFCYFWYTPECPVDCKGFHFRQIG